MNVLNKVKCLAVISIFLFFIGCQTDDFENTLLEDMATVPDEREPNENEGITNEEELEAGSITLYNVAGSVLTKTTDFSVSAELREEQQATDKHQKIWNLVLQFLPESYLTKINQFVIQHSGQKRSRSMAKTNGIEIIIMSPMQNFSHVLVFRDSQHRTMTTWNENSNKRC